MCIEMLSVAVLAQMSHLALGFDLVSLAHLSTLSQGSVPCIIP